MTTVLDASAAFVLLTEGERGAAGLLDDDFAAPDLFIAEVASALRRGERRGVLSPANAGVLLMDLLELPIVLVGARQLVERAFELRHNVTVTDACYVALAEQLGCGLLTADQRLANSPGLPVPVTLV
jgi:predicted nucleic acid-binding protein